MEGDAELAPQEALRNVSAAVAAQPWQAEEVRGVCSSWAARAPRARGQVRAVRVLQVLEFPELPFRHQGFLTALEFAAQELHQPVQVRFQLHRRVDGEGEAAPQRLWGCWW